MSFDELRKFYSEHFSTGYLNITPDKGFSSFERKLILISLICYITYKGKLKNPDVTHYQTIVKLSKNLCLPDDFIKGLAIVCEDFAYGNNGNFPTFGLEGKKILEKIVSILKTYLPFWKLINLTFINYDLNKIIIILICSSSEE